MGNGPQHECQYVLGWIQNCYAMDSLVVTTEDVHTDTVSTAACRLRESVLGSDKAETLENPFFAGAHLQPRQLQSWRPS